MKQFTFSLETVLDYKQKATDALQIEYALLLSQLRAQEEALHFAQRRYAETNREFCQKKRDGLTVAGAISYAIGLEVIEQDICREEAQLKALQDQEVELRAKLLEFKIDTSSLELLRDKKHKDYQHDVQKKEEQLIDELFSAPRENALFHAP